MLTAASGEGGASEVAQDLREVGGESLQANIEGCGRGQRRKAFEVDSI